MIFPTTQWSTVLAAGGASSAAASVALEHLCRIYWFPLYAYARANGATVPDAEDLVQSFFAELIEGNLVDERANIYALGAILYCILTLRPPVSGKDASSVSRTSLRA